MGAGQNKLFLELLEKPILIHTLEVFEQDENCTGIWLAVKPEERAVIQKMLANYGISIRSKACLMVVHSDSIQCMLV
ncbi:hypothetical protein LSPH24S_04794 [Lysinibacillus sphaericus]